MVSEYTSLPTPYHTNRTVDVPPGIILFIPFTFILQVMQKNLIKVQWMPQHRKSLLFKPQDSTDYINTFSGRIVNT